MDKSESFFKKIGRAVNDPKYIKPLLIIICCLAVLLSVLIVAAGLQARSRRQREAAAAVMAESAELAKQTTLLSAVPGQGELYITVSDEAGGPIRGQAFRLTVQYPNGSVYAFDTEEDGNCRLYQLPAGEYRVELAARGNYAGAGPLLCYVEGQAPMPESGEGPAVLDAEAKPRYAYRVLLGPNGFLLSNETHRESRVLPIDRDGDGVPEYGIELVPAANSEDADGNIRTTDAYSRRVELFREDNLPVEGYAIEAVPLTAEPGVLQGWQVIDGKICYYRNGYRVTGLQRIEGKLYYFDPEGVRARALGIDASYYNEHIDWKQVKEQGIEFAIVRIGGRGWSTGAPYGDLRAHEYLMEGQEAGVRMGVYFYTTAINTREAMEEAQAALRALDGIRLELPIFIDMEQSGEYPRGRSDNLTTAERMEVIRTFCETVRAAGYDAGIYSGQYFYQRKLHYPALSRYMIWMANYTSYGQLPDFPERYDIWQFTDRGTVAGIPGHADMNVMF